jgi:hypothetical protein
MDDFPCLSDINEELPNDHTINTIISMISAQDMNSSHDSIPNSPAISSRSELDSHANMMVLGRNSFIFESTNRSCNVKPFSSELGIAENVPIVDGAIAYDDEYTGETYILIMRNALYIPSMHINLLPPFIMRAGGVIVNDIPKIHCKNPSSSDHSISFHNSPLCIPLKLSGTFSYFNHRVPTSEELQGCDKLFITPDSTIWNPHCPSFSHNENSMLDYNGNMAETDRRLHLLMEPDHFSDYELSAISVDQWCSQVEDNLNSNHNSDDFVSSDDCKDQCVADLAIALSEKAEISKFCASIGSCTIGQVDPINDIFESDIDTAYDDLDNIFSKTISPSTDICSTTASQPSGVSSKTLSKLWCINEKLATKAIDQTTQLNRQSADNSLSRNFSTNDRMLRYRRINSTFFTDTLFVTDKARSTRNFKACQLFVSDKGYIAAYPMERVSDFEKSLHLFCKDVGVPLTLVADPHPSQKSYSVRRFCDQVGTTLRLLEKSTQWANRAELYIGLIKEAVRKDLRSSNAPMVLWDFCIERRVMIHNVTPRSLFQNKGMNPHTITFGATADISNLCNFGWYEWIYYRDHGIFPINKEKLGRVLGPIKNEGNEMAQAILTSSGKIIPRRTIRKLRDDEINNPIEATKRSLFDEVIRKKLGDSANFPKPAKPIHLYGPDDNGDLIDCDGTSDDEDENDPSPVEQPMTDHFIHSEVVLPQRNNMRSAKVKGRSLNDKGELIGKYDPNPMLNTLVYDVEFPDGEIKEYSANIIAENIYSQVDDSGTYSTNLDSILSHKTDDSAVHKQNRFIISKTGRKHLRKTTDGYYFQVLWKDGSKQWLSLKKLKESNPVDIAEYAVSVGIDDEPAFAWWIPFTLRKRDRIISSVNSRVAKVTHKYGCEIPSSISQAYAIDRKNNNSLWRDAINKEMENMKVAFDILPAGQRAPVGYTKSSGHIVFEVRMTLERKARWVKDGHRTKNPENSTYAGVVSRESVRIALLSAALNALPVCACDIQNAYLQAPSSEKHYVICGPEFGLDNIGKVAIIVRALYGGKSAGADYWRHVRQAMTTMNFKACTADPDVWMRAGTKSDGTTYWQYVLLYTDDILAIMEEPELFIRQELGSRFTIKPKSIGPPSQYLGNKVSEVTLENGTKCWSFSSSQYVQNAVSNVETYLKSRNKKLPLRSKSPWTTNYRPEIDISPELNATESAYYQSLIGVLRWIVELGRGDICMEVSAMASMMASPREGHLDQLFHTFAFLKGNHNGVMVFDPTEPTIDDLQFPEQDWSATPYAGSSEMLPPNMCEPRGVGMTMRAFVDSDHATDTTNRRSRTGFIIFLNNAPIYWFSKKQTSVETSSFGSEFIAMKQCCEYIRGLRYKLRQMGIAIDKPTYIFGDNKSVLVNSSEPHSQLKKKSSSIAYHFVREGVAKGEWRATYLNTHLNPADLLTKSLAGGEKRTLFTSYFLHYLS